MEIAGQEGCMEEAALLSSLERQARKASARQEGTPGGGNSKGARRGLEAGAAGQDMEFGFGAGHTGVRSRRWDQGKSRGQILEGPPPRSLDSSGGLDGIKRGVW